MTFLLPQALLLLLPAFALLAWRGWPMGWTGLLRATTVLLLLVALSRPSCTLPEDGRDVVVVVDRSRSMPAGSDTRAEELIRQVEGAAGTGDRVGIVTFGREARLERAPVAGAHFSGFQRTVDGNGSDLPGALRLARETLAPGRAGRLLVLSDGLSTGAEAKETARALAAGGVPVDFRLLSRANTGSDVAVRSLDLPSQVAPGEPFQFSATVTASQEGVVPYVLRRGEAILARGSATVHPGDNVLTFRDRIDSRGLAQYSLDLADAHDAVPENDRGRAVLRVNGPLRVLVVRTDGRESALARALRESRFEVTVTADAPRSLATLDGVGVVVLENVPASALGQAGLETLAQYVREVGGGLLMTGGRQSFGQGGYHLSALEPVLPVSMELRQEQRRAHVALGISLDRSGSMSVPTADGRPKMALAAEGAVGALGLLGAGDEATAWVVDTGPHTIFPLRPVEQGLDLDLLASVTSMGGGIYIGVALEAAADELAKSHLQTRHLILFADANDSEEPGNYRETLAKMRKEGITTSVIGMGARTDRDAALLEEVARLGDGQIYFAAEVGELPRLFAQDTIVLERAALVEDPTPLSLAPDMAVLGAPEGGGLPRLGGYNLTYLRPHASVALRTEDDNKAPVLAFWQAGLGQAAVWTGEVDGPLSGGLHSWNGFRSLMSRVVRHLVPPPGGGEVLARARRVGDALRVTVELDETTATRSGPGSVSVLSGDASDPPQQATLRWEDGHRMSATLPLAGNGTFLPVVQVAGRTLRVAPVALPYASEFEPRDPTEGHALLAEVAALTGGQERTAVREIFSRETAHVGLRPIDPLLVAIALPLLLLEILLRRLFPGGLPFPVRQRRPRAQPAPQPESQPVAVVAPPAPATEAPAPVPSQPPPSDLSDVLKKASSRARRRM